MWTFLWPSVVLVYYFYICLLLDSLLSKSGWFAVSRILPSIFIQNYFFPDQGDFRKESFKLIILEVNKVKKKWFDLIYE